MGLFGETFEGTGPDKPVRACSQRSRFVTLHRHGLLFDVSGLLWREIARKVLGQIICEVAPQRYRLSDHRMRPMLANVP